MLLKFGLQIDNSFFKELKRLKDLTGVIKKTQQLQLCTCETVFRYGRENEQLQEEKLWESFKWRHHQLLAGLVDKS